MPIQLSHGSEAGEQKAAKEQRAAEQSRPTWHFPPLLNPANFFFPIFCRLRDD
jgi:hypothetical protein